MFFLQGQESQECNRTQKMRGNLQIPFLGWVADIPMRTKSATMVVNNNNKSMVVMGYAIT